MHTHLYSKNNMCHFLYVFQLFFSLHLPLLLEYPFIHTSWAQYSLEKVIEMIYLFFFLSSVSFRSFFFKKRRMYRDTQLPATVYL